MQETKVYSITAENCKAVESFYAVLNGQSAHVTGQNKIGKSTVIRVLWDRLNGLKPSIITNTNAEEGSYIMELTDGGKFVWEFSHAGKESIKYYSKDGFQADRDGLKSIISRYFKNTFDINKFLVTTQPMERLKMISDLINVDLTEYQKEYKKQFDVRTEEKRILKTLEVQKIKTPTLVIEPKQDVLKEVNDSIENHKKEVQSKKQEIQEEKNALNEKYRENRKENDLKQSEHNKKHDALISKISEQNKIEKAKNEKREKLSELNKKVSDLLIFSELRKCYNYTSAFEFIDNLEIGKEEEIPNIEKLDLPNPMPSNDNLVFLENELSLLEEKTTELNEEKQKQIELTYKKRQEFTNYTNELIAYEKHFLGIQKQQEIVREHENLVEKALDEIKKVIKDSKLPEEFEIDLLNKNDILFNGFPINRETLASSAIYIAAFKLAAFNLDLFRVVHFDVSFLDYLNRLEVLEEAKRLNIQLITESPAQNESELNLQVTLHSLD